MGKVISFHDNPVKGLKNELSKKEIEIEKIQRELTFFKHVYSSTSSIGDLLKLQLADITSNISLLEGHLSLVQTNLSSVRAKIEQLEQMKTKITIIDE